MDDPKKKKETPEEIKKNVSNKLFMRIEKRKTKTEPILTPMQKKMKEMNEKDKKYRPFGDQVSRKDNVFNTLKEKSEGKKKAGLEELFKGNATELIDDDELKVNKKHQSRVNKILGK